MSKVVEHSISGTYTVEVFKTDVTCPDKAKVLIDHIQNAFYDYQVNFDLEDCDRILRIKCVGGVIQSDTLITFLQRLGCNAEVLQ
jgi:hypothetical protein